MQSFYQLRIVLSGLKLCKFCSIIFCYNKIDSRDVLRRTFESLTVSSTYFGAKCSGSHHPMVWERIEKQDLKSNLTMEINGKSVLNAPKY